MGELGCHNDLTTFGAQPFARVLHILAKLTYGFLNPVPNIVSSGHSSSHVYFDVTTLTVRVRRFSCGFYTYNESGTHKPNAVIFSSTSMTVFSRCGCNGTNEQDAKSAVNPQQQCR